MTRAVPIDRLLTDIVSARRALRQTRERPVRQRLRDIERSLRTTLGPGVPKRAAAKALGVSVTALDKWIDRGVLPVVARGGSSRHRVEARALLDLLDQVTVLREQGVEHKILTAAIERLGWRDDPGGRQVLSEDLAALPRPNVSARELREHFERSTPEERVAEAARLSSVLTRIALQARR